MGSYQDIDTKYELQLVEVEHEREPVVKVPAWMTVDVDAVEWAVIG